jgi:hypothetical protein
MTKRLIPAGVAVLALILAMMMMPVSAEPNAQSTTPTARPRATATPRPRATTVPAGTANPASQSTVAIFFVACNNQAVVNFTGDMKSGYTVYYQVFSNPKGTGNALTALRKTGVTGKYAFSETVPYINNATLAGSAIGSVRVLIARDSDSNRSVLDTTVDDLQDGCNAPQNPLGASTDAGSISAEATAEADGPAILSPFGGTINPFRPETPVPLVVIGARTQVGTGRSGTPGVIFAECDRFLSRAAPGLLYDNDNITIFWSWFAKTEQEVADHIAQAQYDVKLNRAPLGPVIVSAITKRTQNFWVFYSVPIGPLRPGNYGVEFRLNWKAKISDGFDDYGPGTKNQEVYSTCTFKVELNPDHIGVGNYNLMYSNQPQ